MQSVNALRNEVKVKGKLKLKLKLNPLLNVAITFFDDFVSFINK